MRKSCGGAVNFKKEFRPVRVGVYVHTLHSNDVRALQHIVRPDHVQQGCIQASLHPRLRIPLGPTYISPPPSKPPPLSPPLAAAMAPAPDMPQVHSPDRPAPTPPLLPNLGTTHRNRPLLAIMDHARDRAINAPARMFQARAGFPGL
jgi:hypothetical protein